MDNANNIEENICKRPKNPVVHNEQSSNSPFNIDNQHTTLVNEKDSEEFTIWNAYAQDMQLLHRSAAHLRWKFITIIPSRQYIKIKLNMDDQIKLQPHHFWERRILPILEVSSLLGEREYYFDDKGCHPGPCSKEILRALTEKLSENSGISMAIICIVLVCLIIIFIVARKAVER